jgi:hypothetical protein
VNAPPIVAERVLLQKSRFGTSSSREGVRSTGNDCTESVAGVRIAANGRSLDASLFKFDGRVYGKLDLTTP